MIHYSGNQGRVMNDYMYTKHITQSEFHLGNVTKQSHI